MKRVLAVAFITVVLGLLFMAGGHGWYAALPVAAMIGFITAFASWYILPWFDRRRAFEELHAALVGVRKAWENDRGAVDLRLRLSTAFAGRSRNDDPLAHAWHEYQETLHKEHQSEASTLLDAIDVDVDVDEDLDEDGTGVASPRPSARAPQYRQTEPSNAFFSYASQIEMPLAATFFAHLPGILTSLGIVATFGGLIAGLGDFNPGNTSNATAEITPLIAHVHDAFAISATAIGFAILTTFVEKAVLVDLRRRLMRVTEELDALFNAGVGEEYLSKLVQSSDESAERLGHLREGLINDLRPLLEEQTDRQLEAQDRATGALSATLVEQLEEPLRRLAEASERTQEQNVEANIEVMRAALGEFSNQVGSVFSEHLGDAVTRMERAADSLGDVLDRAAAAGEPMAEHAERISVSSDKLAKTVEDASLAFDYGASRMEKFGKDIGYALDQVDGLVASLTGAGDGLVASIANAGDGFVTSISGAGDGFVASISGAGDGLVASMTGAGDALNSSIMAAEATARQFQAASDRMTASAQSLAELLDRIEAARGSDEELIGAISEAASAFGNAQKEVETFLEMLAERLNDAHGVFTRELSRTIDSSTHEFQDHLGRATKTLADAVDQFGSFYEDQFRSSVEGLDTVFRNLDELVIAGRSTATEGAS